jgi:hypothetical protein
MKIFLKIQHWQLFFLTLGICLLAELLLGSMILLGVETFATLSIFYYLIVGLACTIYFLWLGTTSHYMYHKILTANSKQKVSITWLKTLLIIAYIGYFALSYYWSWRSNPLHQNQYGSLSSDPLIYIAGIGVFIFFISLFYALNIFAKILVMSERKNQIPSSEYFSEYVMAVVFPIGVWFLQPRINRLFETLPKR